MLQTHYISKPRLITKYKGSEPFRLSADYTYDKNIDLVAGNFATFVTNDLVLLNNQTDVKENGLYLFNGTNLVRYQSAFLNAVDKIYAIDDKDGEVSYRGFFGPGNSLNQLHSIMPGQGVIIVCKTQAQLPLVWYTYNDDVLPSIVVDRNITKHNFINLGLTVEDADHNEPAYSLNLNSKTYQPVVLTSRLGASSDPKDYILELDIIGCPDPEYVDVAAKINLIKSDFASPPKTIGGPSQFQLSSSTVASNKFGGLREGSIVWIVNSEYTIDDLYVYNGYLGLDKLHKSEYSIKNKKYVIETKKQTVASLPDSSYINHIINITYNGHYDIFFKLTDATTGVVVSEDNYCFNLTKVINMPQPTPTVTPTPAIHSVAFDDGNYLKVDECEGCVKRYLSVTASSLLLDGDYYYEFGLFDKGELSPRDTDGQNDQFFEPQVGYLSTGKFTQKFGTYFSTEHKVRSTVYVKLTNLNTNISSIAYITLSICDENYCEPDPTPTPTPTNARITYPKRTPTPTASPI
jgi:hypothetical protein